MKKIFIWWVQWVWKSTITRLLTEKNSSLWRFSFWERMTDIDRTDIVDYNWFHLLSDHQREDIVQKTRKQLVHLIDWENYTNLLFDNHFTIVRWNLIHNTFDDEEIIFYDKIVLLYSWINDIIQRILKDWKKERVELAKNYDFIKKHQELEITRADFLSNKYSIEIIKILNNNLNNTLEQIEKFIY